MIRMSNLFYDVWLLLIVSSIFQYLNPQFTIYYLCGTGRDVDLTGFFQGEQSAFYLYEQQYLKSIYGDNARGFTQMKG